MKTPFGFYVDVNKILLAHECILDTKSKFDYSSGRGSFGLVFVLDGEADFNFSSSEGITVTKGDTLLISDEAAYSIAVKKPFWHYTVNFSIHKKNSIIKLLDTPTGIARLGDTLRFEFIFKRLVSTWSIKKASYEMQSTSILYELLTNFYTEYISKSNDAIERILISKEYIEQHFSENISLNLLANLSNMSVTNFYREWAKLFEDPPLRYRDAIRLNYAKEYLNTKYYTVSEVAEKCGFSDVNYFVRFFKKHTGTTPGKF